MNLKENSAQIKFYNKPTKAVLIIWTPHFLKKKSKSASNDAHSWNEKNTPFALLEKCISTGNVIKQ